MKFSVCFALGLPSLMSFQENLAFPFVLYLFPFMLIITQAAMNMTNNFSRLSLYSPSNFFFHGNDSDKKCRGIIIVFLRRIKSLKWLGLLEMQ